MTVSPRIGGSESAKIRNHRFSSLMRTVARWLALAPFATLTLYFLLFPTAIVLIGAFLSDDGAATLQNFQVFTRPAVQAALVNSLVVSLVSALTGAVLGSLVAYAVVLSGPQSVVRRVVTAAAGVFAQFGGVTLAFAFIATVGGEGLLTIAAREWGLLDSTGAWLFSIPGLLLVYTYFQVPLMVLVFLPALDGVAPQWREATQTLGGSTWTYWRRVAGPLLAPAFISATLLLFANALAAYATAASLITQGGVLLPLQIRLALTSEVALGEQNAGKAIALFMVAVVAIVMALQTWLQRRQARWLR